MSGVGTGGRGARLVGRAAELADLEAERRRSAGGEFRAVLLLGDPGVGKTRLAAEFVARHRGRALGLTARAYPLGATASFDLWIEALERHLQGLAADEIRRLCGGYLDDLAVLLRSVAAASSRPREREREPPRGLLLAGLATLVGNLARQTPVLIALDDLHLADASSWETFHYLARTLPEARVLVLATARPGELDRRATAEVLVGLEQEGLLRRLPLGPLAREHLAELAATVVRRAPPEPLVAWLVERTRGNPLFALGLLHALLDEGADLAAPRLRALPEALGERVQGRLALLDEPSLATLEVLAVLGRRVELGELVRLSGRPLERLAVILEGLVRSRLVAEEELGRVLTHEIAHPLIQEAIYRGIGGARRRALHRLVARALLAADRLGEAAPHFARSAEPGDPEAIDALRDALRQVEERESHREALAILGALRDLLPPGDARWLAVLDAMPWQAEWVIEHRAGVDAEIGIEALREIERLLEDSPDLARRGTVQFRLASFLAWISGDLGAAERACRRARELFAQAGQRGLALLATNELAWIQGLAGDLAGQAVAASEVLALAEAAGERLVVMQALGSLAAARSYQGRFAEAEAGFRRSSAIAHDDGKRYRLTWSLAHLAHALAHAGRLDEARALIEQAMASNPGYRDTILVEWSTPVHWLAGDFPAVVASADAVVAWNPAGLSRRRAWVLALAAMALTEGGRLGEARDTLARAESVYAGRAWFVISHFCPWAAGVLAGREGRTDDGLALLQATSSRLLAAGALPLAAFVLADLAEAAGRADLADLALQAAGELERIAGRLDRNLYHALAALGLGWARLAGGDHDDAIAPAQTAVALLAGSGYRAFHGRALDLLGRALARRDRERAVAALEGAVALFEECGAAWRRDAALGALGDLGHRGRKAVAAARGAGALSQREREVARLAAQGSTAREIGERLFIGERTVESHLANAYAKLGVASRVELMRRAAELGL